MLCRFRFLTYVFMLIPSNANIQNGFTNICLITNTRSFINLARWVRVLIFQRKQTFNFLSDPLNSIFKLLIGELMGLWQEWFSYGLILWAIWKLHLYWFIQNFKNVRWYNVVIFLLFSSILLMIITSDEWHYLCKVTGDLIFSLLKFEDIRSALHKSPWIVFRLYFFWLLEGERGVSFVTLQSTLEVIDCCYNIS